MRVRHAAIAILFAIVFAVMGVFRPLDITLWSLQAKLFSHAPSGEIVYVTDRTDLLDGTAATTNARIAEAVGNLAEGGARRIAIDTPLQRSQSVVTDAQLRETLLRHRDRVVLTSTIAEEHGPEAMIPDNDAYFSDGIDMASSDFRDDFLGFVWFIRSSFSSGDAELPALWSVLAGQNAPPDEISVDYSIDMERIPTLDLTQVANSAPSDNLAFGGRTFLISDLSDDTRLAKLPGYGRAPSGLVHIIAAETFFRGAGTLVPAYIMIGLFGLSLLAIAMRGGGQSRRRILYGVWSAALVFLIVAFAKAGIRAAWMDSLAILVVFAVLRGFSQFKRRHVFVEPRSRLPNFMALQRDLPDSGAARSCAIVVAKIARLDAIFASLSPGEQRQYLRQIAARLSLGENGTRMYYDGGKYFAFALPLADYPDLGAHLEGLRAVTSQAVAVAGTQIDVSMTIGADTAVERSVSSRISSAIAAADQAREAYRPVFVISDFEKDSEDWDHSLQARLETALSEDRISIKLQSKAHLDTGLICGAEALARWVDVERGEIPPAQFVLQCERAGRLDDLTRRVVLKSLEASADLSRRGLPASISVNVSAIQLVDRRVVEIISRALEATRADPRDITVEITETARIDDFATARAIMEEMRRTGLHFSIDDFGVASANLDVLFQLPFDELKLDRMFVAAMPESASARAIAENTIRLARDVGLVSVAEGIENRQDCEMLRAFGCDLGQGFYFSKPQTYPLYAETLSLQEKMDRARSG